MAEDRIWDAIIVGGGIVGAATRGLVARVFAVEYALKQYGLQQGALEIQYIEEFFFDFPRKKTAAEVINRLADRRLVGDVAFTECAAVASASPDE